MKLRKLSEHTPLIYIPSTISTEKELYPTTNPRECGENSILFIYKRISGEYSVSENEITIPPYAIIADEDYKGAESIPIIRVASVRRAISFAFFCESGFHPERTKLIGVTGTNGKTTTATIIYNLLMGAGIKCGQIGTGLAISAGKSLIGKNESMTTPDPERLYSLLREMQNDGCSYVVMEVSSHALALEKLTPLVFEYGIFTNLSKEHLDFHSGLEDYFEAKMKLFDNAARKIINIDDEYGERAYASVGGEKISVGIINKGDTYATDFTFSGALGTEFYYRNERVIFKTELPLPGAFNVYNAMLAMACAIDIGIAPCVVKRIIKTINRIDGRMERVNDRPTVIIDYAHTPFALENALKVMYSNNIPGQRLIVVFGCGGNRDRDKRPMMGSIAEKYADEIVLTEDNSRTEPTESIIGNILSGINNKDIVTVIPDRREAIIYALSVAGYSDTVAIIGKGHEKYIIKDGVTLSFNEKEIVADYFSREGLNEN